MKRKDGLPKAKALRNMPVFSVGHKDSLAADRCGFNSPPMTPITVLSLFSGCGGLDLGFHGGFEALGATYPRTNFQVLNALDCDQDCVDCYKLNIGRSERCDLSTVDIRNLPSVDVLMGGFPCQDFSSSGTKLGTATDRGKLYQILVRYADYHRPRVVIGENVPLLQRLANGVYLKEIIAAFGQVGYKVNIWRIVCQDHGLPQSRTRLFIVATNVEELKLPPPHFSRRRLFIDEALADLEEVVDESVPNQSQYFVADVATCGGGQGDHTNMRGTFAYTIRANARARIQFHYSLPRRLTVRECARLQGFPDSFVFQFSAMRNMKLIGNAVPPTIAHAVAGHLQHILDGNVPLAPQGELLFV
jgi:DNA (cytosine-5)-methyltransferase 1